MSGDSRESHQAGDWHRRAYEPKRAGIDYGSRVLPEREALQAPFHIKYFSDQLKHVAGGSAEAGTNVEGDRGPSLFCVDRSLVCDEQRVKQSVNPDSTSLGPPVSSFSSIDDTPFCGAPNVGNTTD